MSASSKQLMITMGALGAFIVTTGVGYYVGFSQTWNAFKSQPLIGDAPIELQVVKVLKDIPAYGRIDGGTVEEARMLVPGVYSDFYGFVSDCAGRQTKWTLKKGTYVSRHDLVPASAEVK